MPMGHWLESYRGRNVAVFDFYNVLTGPDNHHRLRNGKIEHVANSRQNTLHYASDGDDHPSRTGNRKATEEFVPLLNAHYNHWIAGARRPVLSRLPRVEINLARPLVRPMVVRIDTRLPVTPQHGPAGPRPLRQIESSDRDVDRWQAIFDPATGTRLDFRRDQHVRHNGAAAMQIRYDVELW